MGEFSLSVTGKIEDPIVADNKIFLNNQSYVFKTADFTKDFEDPEGGDFSFVTLLKVPQITTLLYSGTPVQSGEVIHANNMFDMNLALDDKYAIHNGHLYEFSKSIDEIITDHEASGYKLVYNSGGLLGFAKPSDVADIVVVKGTSIAMPDLTFEFTVRSDISNQESNTARLEIIPWENVNLKDNNIFAGVAPAGQDGKSAYEVAIDNGFIGTESQWLAALVGAKGDQGIQGPKGNDGTSVTIKGSFTDSGNLPASGIAGDGYLVNGFLYVWNGSIWENVGLIRGPKGDNGADGNDGANGQDGRSIEYIWDGTRLGIRYVGQTVYVYSDLKGDKGLKGDTGNTGAPGISAYQVWLNLGNSGSQQDFINAIKGLKGDTGSKGADGDDGMSAYEVWQSLGNNGTMQDFIDSLTGPQGERGPRGYQGLPGNDGADATFTHNEISYNWTTGQSQIFTVPDSAAITDVYVQGKRAEKQNPDETPDEWRVFSATQIEILVALDNNDRITFVESSKFSVSDIEDMLGYLPAKQSDLDALQIQVDNIQIPEIIDALNSTFTDKALSANQGRILNGFINDINTLLSSDDTTLDEIQEIVNYIKANKADLDNLSISNIAGLQAALDAKEALVNKASTFAVKDDTLYPTVKAVSDYIIAQGFLTGITEAQIEEALSYVIFKALGEQNLELDSPNTSSTIYFRENGAATFYSFIRYNAAQNFFEFGSNDGSGEVISAVIDRGKTDWEFQNHIQILKAGRGVIFGSTTFNDTDIYSKGGGGGRYELRVQGSGVLELWSVDNTNTLDTKVWDSETVTQAEVETALGYKQTDMSETDYEALTTPDVDTYYFLYE